MSDEAGIPFVYERELVSGSACKPGAPPDLLIEVPHGATEKRHYDTLRGRLATPLPDSLLDFFFVNTDVGAPECARALAQRITESAQGRTRSVVVLRCLVPRTFADCNREMGASPAELASGGLTAAIPGYVTDEADVRLLADLHARYQEAVEREYERVCGGEGGTAILFHTYAPRSIELEVDADVGRALRAAYAPDRYERWPLRPEVDLITATPEGQYLAPRRLVEAVRAGYERLGVTVGENATYRLHPGTTAHRHASRRPGRVLCIEISRARLGDPWEPFGPTRLSDARVRSMVGPLAEAWTA